MPLKQFGLLVRLRGRAAVLFVELKLSFGFGGTVCCALKGLRRLGLATKVVKRAMLMVTNHAITEQHYSHCLKALSTLILHYFSHFHFSPVLTH